MFGSNILEIAIGVVFIFLTVSLICTAINEIIAGFLRSRSRNLAMGIHNILEGTTNSPTKPPMYGKNPKAAPPATWTEKFFAHRLIDALSKDNKFPSYVPSRTFATTLRHLIAEWSQPASIAAAVSLPKVPLSGVATFADLRKAILNIPNNPQLQAALLGLLEEARGDSNPELPDSVRFDRQLQIWYDVTMDRVSGWYKRKTRLVLLGIGIVTAILANIDTIHIFRVLSSDSTVRAAVVAEADRTVKAAQPPVGTANGGGSNPSATASQSAVDPLTQLGRGLGELSHLGIPIGWLSSSAAHPLVEKARHAMLEAESNLAQAKKNANSATNDQTHKEYSQQANNLEIPTKTAEANYDASRLVADRSPNPDCLDDYRECPKAQITSAAFWTKVLGWLLTAVAASLGAPFWFDLLNKFMSIRAAGKAPEERPKDPKEVLQPQSP